MVAKNKNRDQFNYRYAGDAKDSRTDEYRFVKYFNMIAMICYLVSSIWIIVFIFKQAEWEYNLKYENARLNAAVTTWKWWTLTSVIMADILALVFLAKAIYGENPKLLLTLSILSFGFAIWGIGNVYLRGSIVCFVFPFTVATFSAIQYILQLGEDKEFKISQDLRLVNKPAPTMETFLDDHERELEKF